MRTWTAGNMTTVGLPRLVTIVALVIAFQIKEASSAPHAQRYFMEKHTFSDSRRAVFVAGLEGTGHHVFRELSDPCSGVEAKRKNGKKKSNHRRTSSERRLPGDASGGEDGQRRSGTESVDMFHDQCVEDKVSMCLLYNNSKKSPNPHDSLFNSQSPFKVFQDQRVQ